MRGGRFGGNRWKRGAYRGLRLARISNEVMTLNKKNFLQRRSPNGPRRNCACSVAGQNVFFFVFIFLMDKLNILHSQEDEFRLG